MVFEAKRPTAGAFRIPRKSGTVTDSLSYRAFPERPGSCYEMRAETFRPMANVLIVTDCSELPHFLVRGEPLPVGVILNVSSRRRGANGGRWLMKVDLQLISGPDFAMWLLRKFRSFGGEHRIEIGGSVMPRQMPEAIDIIAEAVVNAQHRTAA